jgi:hypothetical protein
MATPVWSAQSKTELRRAYQEAAEQENLVNAAFAVYDKAAKALGVLVEENGDEIPTKRDDPKLYKEYRDLVAQKRKMFVAWQREAQKHGALFVQFMQRQDIDPQGGVVWSS